MGAGTPGTTLVAVVAMMVTGLAACSGRADPDADATPTSIAPGPLPDPPRVGQAVAAIEALSLGECHLDAGSQTVKGTLTGVARKPADYLVTISWTDDEGTVLGRGYTVVPDLPGKDKADFTIEAHVASGATMCIPGVVRGRIAS